MARKKTRRRKGAKSPGRVPAESWQYIERLNEWRFGTSAKTPAGVIHKFTVTATTKTECRLLARDRIQKIKQGLSPVHEEVKEYFARWLKDYGYAWLGSGQRAIFEPRCRLVFDERLHHRNKKPPMYGRWR